jgi:uncharacterized membrane protein
MSGSEVLALLIVVLGVIVGDALTDGRVVLVIVLVLLLAVAAFEWRRRN